MIDPILEAYQRGQSELIPIADRLRMDMAGEYSPECQEFGRDLLARLTAIIGEGHARMNLRLAECEGRKQ